MLMDIIKNLKLKVINIKKKIFRNEAFEQEFKKFQAKGEVIIKYFGKKFHSSQDKIEKSFKFLVFDESLLKQSDFWVKSVTWTLIGTSSFAVLWLVLAKTDEVVVAVGKLEPKGDVKDIQMPIGGVVKEIFVTKGDVVSKNQKLIQLDEESTYGQFISLKSSINEKEVQLKKNIKILSLKKNQKLEEEKMNNEKSDLLFKKLKISEDILKSMSKLKEVGAISKIEYLDREIEYKELISQINQIQIEGERSKILTDQEISNLESQQAIIKSDLSKLKAELIQAQVNLKYLSINSPVEGIVFDLKPTSPGYVARSSEPIMKIVPFNDLEADIEIPSNKIGFVKNNMPVEISIDSFPASDFGVLKGKLDSIGSDALPPSQAEGRIEYSYPATVKLDSQELLLKGGKSLPLQVGMSLSANIKLRKVSYIQLLFRTLSNKANSIKKT